MRKPHNSPEVRLAEPKSALLQGFHSPPSALLCGDTACGPCYAETA